MHLQGAGIWCVLRFGLVAKDWWKLEQLALPWSEFWVIHIIAWILVMKAKWNILIEQCAPFALAEPR